MLQNPNIWDVTDFQSIDGVELISVTPSYIDKDDDIILVAKFPLAKKAQNIATVRFTSPIKEYQFIEIDVYAINDNIDLDIVAVNDYGNYDPINGTYARAAFPTTIGHVKTYRLPYVGPIEAFVFANFVQTGTFIIKDIRFFSLPPTLRKVLPVLPDSIDFEFGIRYEDLIGEYAEQQIPYQELSAIWNAAYGRFEFTVISGPQQMFGQAVFNWISSNINNGVIRVTVPQLGRTGLGRVEMEDQLTVAFTQASAYVTETLVDRDRTVIPFRAFFSANTLTPEDSDPRAQDRRGITYWFQLFNVVSVDTTNVWGTDVSQTEELGYTINPLLNLRGERGIPGKDGVNGLNGTNGTNGTNGANGLDGELLKQVHDFTIEELATAYSLGSNGPIIVDAPGSGSFITGVAQAWQTYAANGGDVEMQDTDQHIGPYAMSYSPYQYPSPSMFDGGLGLAGDYGIFPWMFGYGFTPSPPFDQYADLSLVDNEPLRFTPQNPWLFHDSLGGVFSISQVDPGSGYEVNEIVYLMWGDVNARVLITGVDEFGGITSWTITDVGTGYTTTTDIDVTYTEDSPGSLAGVAATFDILVIDGTSAKVRVITWYVKTPLIALS